MRRRDVVGPHLDQRGHRDLRADHPLHERRRRAPRDERQHHEVVALTQVRALVGEHRDDLGRVQRLQRPDRQHQPGSPAGQAVRDGRGVVEDMRTGNRGPGGGEHVEQVAVAAPRP